MRLLVLTQAVDRTDAALGFFHTWLESFSSRFESIEVVCLKEGRHVLPGNVRVRSLGKERDLSRLRYVLNFYRYALSFDYDAVFVHMNEEYVLLGGLLWRLAGKKVVLWRNHRQGSWRTALAVKLAHEVCYTSPEAFTARYKKALRMPVGVDTDFFAPPPALPRAGSVLFFGRLDPVKKVDVFVESLREVARPFHAQVVGSPTEPGSAYAEEVAALAEPLLAQGSLSMLPAVPYERTAELYRRHAIYVNLTPSGSFDKTIGEAMASGCMVVCANRALGDVVPNALFVEPIVPEAVARALGAALAMSEEERKEAAVRNRSYVEREHSLRLLSERLADILKPHA